MKWAVLGWGRVNCRPAAGGQGIGWAACGRGKLVWVCLYPVGMVLAGHEAGTLAARRCRHYIPQGSSRRRQPF